VSVCKVISLLADNKKWGAENVNARTRRAFPLISGAAKLAGY